MQLKNILYGAILIPNGFFINFKAYIFDRENSGNPGSASCPEIVIVIEEELMLAKRKIIFNIFTIVELLAVLAIFGILLAASLKGFPMLFGKQGLVGSVRTLSSKVSMARSYAVTQNRNVALLIPDLSRDGGGTLYTNGAAITPYIYNYSRLCYVDSNNKFEGWIDGEDWYPLANGVCAYIESPVTQAAALKLPPPPIPVSNYTIQKVINILPISMPDNTCSAVVFQSNGTLMNAGSAVIRVNSAFYDKDNGSFSFNVKGGTIQQKRWNVMINPFTGKATYLYGKEQ